MIKIVDELYANAVTHSGKFHADDIFSTVLLEYVLGDVYIYRTYETKEKDDGKIYYDIGGGKFDHHHIQNNKKRDENILYASFGLLWMEYGKDIIKKYYNKDINYIFNYIDNILVKGIDAIDNGVFYDFKLYNILDISSIISLFNPFYDEVIDNDIKFIEACSIAKIIFDRILKKAICMAKSKNIIDKKIEESHDHMLILDEYIPYKEHILSSKNKKASDIYFVIYKSNRKGYMINTLPKSIDDNTLRKKLKKEWAGLRGSQFSLVSGITDGIFCHKNLFVCATLSKKSAIEIVHKALND